MLICEMAAYYRSIGSSIKARLEAIYAKYGRYLNKVNSFEFPGLSGMDKMAGIMASLREKPPVEIGGYKVTKTTDYQNTAQTGPARRQCAGVQSGRRRDGHRPPLRHRAEDQDLFHHSGQGSGGSRSTGKGSRRRSEAHPRLI